MQPNERLRPAEVEDWSRISLFIRAAAAAGVEPGPNRHRLSVYRSLASGSSPPVLPACRCHYESKSGDGGGARQVTQRREES